MAEMVNSERTEAVVCPAPPPALGLSAHAGHGGPRPAIPGPGLGPLVTKRDCPSSTNQPVTVAIPFPKGGLTDPNRLRMFNDQGSEVRRQPLPMTPWHDH